MSNSIFCPNCGMLKSNCTCGNSGNEKSSGPTNLFSFGKTIKSSILDDDIPEVYSVDNHKLDEGTVAYLKEIYPHIDEEIIENFPFNEPRMGQLEIIQDINDAIKKDINILYLKQEQVLENQLLQPLLQKCMNPLIF